MSLLSKAIKINPYKIGKIQSRGEGRQDIELALAWLKGEVGYKQICQVKKFAGSNIYNYLSRNFRKAYLAKKLIIK